MSPDDMPVNSQRDYEEKEDTVEVASLKGKIKDLQKQLKTTEGYCVEYQNMIEQKDEDIKKYININAGIADALVSACHDYTELKAEFGQKEKEATKCGELFYSVYSGINILMGVLGAQGEISTRESVSSDMMGILYDFDGGRFIQDKEIFLKSLANQLNEENNQRIKESE